MFIRATLPADRVDTALAGLAEDLRGLVADPPDDTELAAVAEYCVAQLPSALDSPRTLADLLTAVVTPDRNPCWLTDAATALRAAHPTEIRDAATALFATPEYRAVILHGHD